MGRLLEKHRKVYATFFHTRPTFGVVAALKGLAEGLVVAANLNLVAGLASAYRGHAVASVWHG
jgi:flagellar motor component MotA